ncbi:MAG: putative lipid II flippase FtsW [bacterium]|nr:putative lipid II flippase FtsW [bacterium]MDZ4260347.1 putative lipid II flippase FtsW [Candidatus Sungbacteria bacterium]
MAIKSTKSRRVDLPAQKRTLGRPFLYATLALFVVGFIILSSASMAISYREHGSIAYYTLRQLKLGGIGGLAFLFLCQMIPYRHWKRIALPLMIISFILLALLFIPEISYVAGGARRWLKFGSINFQPSEILKLGFIVYLASWLDARRKEVRSFSYGIMPFALMVSIIGIFLMMQPDFGTFGIIVATAGLLYFLGGGNVSQMGGFIGFGLIASFFLIRMAPYRYDRILAFLDPSAAPQGIGYHINQALIAIGSGGFWGLGFGRSLQKYNYLPEPITDSIFAIFAEEMGFMGICVLLALFGFFFWRALIIARKAPDVFGRLLAMGLTIGIMIQVFVNMAAISGFLPLTGIALPFISYGSTSLIITMGMAGIILNISKYE